MLRKWGDLKILEEMKPPPPPVPGCRRAPRENLTGACPCPNLPFKAKPSFPGWCSPFLNLESTVPSDVEFLAAVAPLFLRIL